ncbi:hypothetical protein OPV22_025239 [Ensete ventricosum]|uniref:ABC transmembrane type-1 domain-containing protein n=1 Tax=Ensete ventricosum TaxID=4639 RepID=A0AAV8P7A0_ENSVE|nr:hypothetical protein OPV22_025239 [Ensete ventricosum]
MLARPFSFKNSDIYVIHQVEFLPSADLVLCMRDGRIAQAGRYIDILNARSEFMELVSAHKHALEALDTIDLDTEYTDAEIWEALDSCQLGEETGKKELKLDSEVNENGENWSVWFSKSTVITIAHRITSVLGSDMVLVLDDGLIVEYGTPARLLKDKSSLFAKLVTEYTMRSSSGFDQQNN